LEGIVVGEEKVRVHIEARRDFAGGHQGDQREVLAVVEDRHPAADAEEDDRHQDDRRGQQPRPEVIDEGLASAAAPVEPQACRQDDQRRDPEGNGRENPVGEEVRQPGCQHKAQRGADDRPAFRWQAEACPHDEPAAGHARRQEDQEG
jgi:hypothetical protein